MKIGIIGSGMVGQTIAAKLVELGHEVTVGTRDAQKLAEWASTVKGKVTVGSFADAAAGELIFLATAGSGTLDALKLAGPSNFDGKVIVDITNPLDFSNGFPPSLSVCNTDSLGEQVQHLLPNAKVVKSLLATMIKQVQADQVLEESTTIEHMCSPCQRRTLLARA